MMEKAIERKELKEYLGGMLDYGMENPYGKLPTNPENILIECRDRLRSNSQFRIDFANALEDLSQNVDFGWVTMYHIVGLIYFQKHNKVEVLDSDRIKRIGHNLLENRESLSQNHKWVGEGATDGIWGDLVRLNQNLIDLHELKVFDS